MSIIYSFGPSPLHKEDVPIDLLPREIGGIRVIQPVMGRAVYGESGLSGLGQVSPISPWSMNINISVWGMILIGVVSIGAFYTMYCMVCEMNRRRR